jgi:hypothetical protein
MTIHAQVRMRDGSIRGTGRVVGISMDGKLVWVKWRRVTKMHWANDLEVVE